MCYVRTRAGAESRGRGIGAVGERWRVRELFRVGHPDPSRGPQEQVSGRAREETTLATLIEVICRERGIAKPAGLRLMRFDQLLAWVERLSVVAGSESGSA